MRNQSQSCSISDSSSFRISGSRTEARAADICCSRKRSIVLTKSGTVSLALACPLRQENVVNGCADVEGGKEPLRGFGLKGGEHEPNRDMLLERGICVPELWPLADLVGRRSASEAARSKRLVVPSAFVEPDRAEQTTATLYSLM